jgi:hypothetical protein
VLVADASAAGSRVYGRSAPIRQAFIRSGSGPPPPLAQVLRGGGRGGEVRLKLFLSLLWIAAAPPHETSFPARGWAELLGLRDPDRAGARRITDAFSFLAARQLVRVERSRGRPSTVFLLDDAGRGTEYKPPGSGHGERYVNLPASFWISGWHVVLSAAAVALLLVLLDQQDFQNPTTPTWVSPARARELYALSSDTWTKGTRELRANGLVAVSHAPVSASGGLDTFGWRRVRNTYRLNMQGLDLKPVVS